MAEWTISNRGDCEMRISDIALVATPYRNRYSWWVEMRGNVILRGYADDMQSAQRAALDALIMQLDAWKAQAVEARVALDELQL